MALNTRIIFHRLNRALIAGIVITSGFGALVAHATEDDGAGALLTGSSGPSPHQVDLTARGINDWVHWATDPGTPLVSKAGGSGDIGTFQPLGDSDVQAFNPGFTKHSWSDGSPIASADKIKTGFRVSEPGEGFTFSLPADTSLREFTLFVGARNAVARLQATLSDGSAAPLLVDVQTRGKSSHSINLSYRASGPGQTLSISFAFQSKLSRGSGWVGIEAATMVVPMPNEFALPFTDDFADAGSAWLITDEALGATSDWKVQNGRYEQLNSMGITGASVQGAQHVGTLSYLSDAAGLTDYTFSVTMQPMVGSSQRFSQDIGALVRYNPATGDQVRLSFSGAGGFSRFERRIGGTVATLGQNSVGFVDTSPQEVEIGVQGSIITAMHDGQKIFGGHVGELAKGTVGLYCRDACAFDNVVIDEIGTVTSVFLARPAANTVVTSSTFDVSAVVVNVEPDSTVKFDVPGATDSCTAAIETSPGLYEATCSVAGTGVYSVEAVYFDAEDVARDTDTHTNVGVGDSYIALGNSITAGLDDSTASDAVAFNGFYVGTQGFEAMLSDRLTNNVRPAVVSNNGVPGDTSRDIIEDRMTGVLERHTDASHLLLTVGVNEAGGGAFLPSGLGCSGAACDGTFKGNVQNIVDAALGANLIPIISRTPPRFGDPFQTPYASPASHDRNVLIREEYNAVISNELIGATLGPDLFSTFLGPENRFYLYATNLHPNALGYHLMAAEFEAAITGESEPVFYAADLCLRLETGGRCQKPLLYKQTLMDVGGDLYIDDESTLVGNIPPELADGRWFTTANTDRNSSNLNYFSFDVPLNSTLYVAYDAGATTVPEWLSSNFIETAMSLTTSGATGSQLTLYRQNNVQGTVTLGAANADFHGAAVNYVAILVEN